MQVDAESVKPIVLNAIYQASEHIGPWVTTPILANPEKVYTIVLKPGGAMLIDQPDLPNDSIDHAYKAKPHFYFILLKNGVAYEGYIYLLNPNFHLSLLRVFTGEAFSEREHWLQTAGNRR